VGEVDGSVVFAKGIAGSLVSKRVGEVDGSVVFAKGIAGSLVSTGGALIGRASIAGASITGASIIGVSIAGASIAGASRALIADSNIAIKRSYSTSSSDGGRYSSFSCFLSSFRWCYPSRLKSLAVK